MPEKLNMTLENDGVSIALRVGGFRTQREINERNRQFWLKQTSLMEQRMADEAILRVAMNDLKSEALRQVPVYSQKTFEGALETAEAARLAFQKEDTKSFQSAFSRKGGAAAKPDALQSLILQIVGRTPNVTARELLARIECQKPHEWDIDKKGDTIEFPDSQGRYKSAPISGLKDRLSRAKKKIATRDKKDSR